MNTTILKWTMKRMREWERLCDVVRAILYIFEQQLKWIYGTMTIFIVQILFIYENEEQNFITTWILSCVCRIFCHLSSNKQIQYHFICLCVVSSEKIWKSNKSEEGIQLNREINRATEKKIDGVEKKKKLNNEMSK